MVRFRIVSRMWNSQNLRVPFWHSVSRKWDSRAFGARHSQTSCVQELLQAESATADRFPVWFRSATRVFDIVPACRPFVFLSLSHLLVGPPPLPLWAPLVPLSIHPFAPLFSFTLISAESYLVLSVSHVRCAIAPLARWSCLPWCGRGGWVVSRPFPGAFPAVSQEGFNLPAIVGTAQTGSSPRVCSLGFT